jgi:hypothetical protein
MANSNVLRVNIRTAKSLIRACWRSGRVPALRGGPGLGKTAIVRQVAAEPEFGLDVFDLIAAAHPAEDFTGLPHSVDRPDGTSVVEFQPIPEIREAFERAVVLFFDEITGGTASTQQALMRIFLEGRVGMQRFHSGGKMAVAYNDAAMTAGGVDISPPMMSRMSQYELWPDLVEIVDYFRGIGEPGTALHDEAVDMAATFLAKPELVDLEPKNELFGCPRSWEFVVRGVVDNADVLKSGDLSRVALASGYVGCEKADSWDVVNKIRNQLPSVEDIATRPHEARLPASVEAKFGLAGLIARVAERDPYAAWIYLGRFDPHAMGTKDSQAVAIQVMKDVDEDRFSKSKFADEGFQARKKVGAGVRTA